MNKEKRKNRAGFTLVELIVVLVILAILAAIAVPTFMGYIKKSKENTAIEECRVVVQAAQIKATELFGENKFSKDTFLNENQDEIMADASSSGTIESIGFSWTDEAVIDTLTYVSSKGIRVLYDRDGERLYRIEEHTVKNANGVYDYAKYLAKQGDGIIFDGPGSENKYEATKKLQKLLKEKNDGKLPDLSADEQELLKRYNATGDFSNVRWKPMYSGTGQIILVADTKDAQPQYEGQTNAMSYMVYYEGKYYVCKNTSNKLANEFIKENDFDMSLLQDQTKLSPSRNHYEEIEL